MGVLTTVLIVLVALVLVVWVSRHFVMNAALRGDPALHATDDASLPEQPPMVSVVIPARNEADNISRTLASVLAQDYPSFEIIVADDRSDDDTPRIVEEIARTDARVRSFRSDDLPEGWTGKNHVLWQASKEARGDVLLFVDADVALDAGALRVMVADLTESGADMLSLVLRLDSSSFWERSTRVLLGSMLMLRHPLRKVNDPGDAHAFANGQIIMIRADAYRDVGGHESVKAVLLEDVALARRIKQAGLRLRVAYGFDMAASRMYASLGDLWRGWSRIFYSAFRGSVPRLMVSALLLVVFTILPYVALIYAVCALAAGAGEAGALVVLATVSAAAVIVMKTLMVRLHCMTRCECAYVALHFPASLFALAILLNAMARRFSPRGIEWKGTRYDTRKRTTETE